MDTGKPVDIRPYKPFKAVQAMSPEDMNAYYDEICKPGAGGLSDIQLYCLDKHTADVQRNAKRWKATSRWSHSPAASVLRYLGNIVSLATFSAAINFTLPFTDPVNWWYAATAYTAIFCGLFALQLFFSIRALFGASANDAVADPSFFEDENKLQSLAAACKVLSGGPPKIPLPFDPKQHDEKLQRGTRRQKILFDTDVAKALLTLSGLVYSRETDWVLKAKELDGPEHKTRVRNLILRSEELIYSTARRYGLSFLSLSDFWTVSGSFVGAFSKIDGLEPGQHPFCVLVIKGTSPTSVTEWAVDGSLKLESAADYLGAGYAHEGFYNSIFPAPSSITTAASPTYPLEEMRITPYKRICDTVKLLGEQALAVTGLPLQVFVAGHSLGAGMASLLYARFLEAPGDLQVPPRNGHAGVQVDLRDAYVYGCPRACSAELASRFEYNLRQPQNYGRMLFSVRNRDFAPVHGDCVTHVPPGWCDERRFRSTITSGSLLSFAAVGLRIDLTPHSSMVGPVKERHYRTGPVPIGYHVHVVTRQDTTDPAGNKKKKQKQKKRDEVRPEPFGPGLAMWLAARCLPWVADHVVSGYWHSLCQVRPKFHQDDEEEVQPLGSASPAIRIFEVEGDGMKRVDKGKAKAEHEDGEGEGMEGSPASVLTELSHDG